MTEMPSIRSFFQDRESASDAITLWQEALWQLIFPKDGKEQAQAEAKGRIVQPEAVWEVIRSDQLFVSLQSKIGSALFNFISETLEAERRLWRTRTGASVLSIRVTDPAELYRQWFPEISAEPDRRYLIYASIRRLYNCHLSSATADVFHSLSAYINSALIAPNVQDQGKQGSKRRLSWDYRERFVPELRDILLIRGLTDKRADEQLQAFTRSLRAAGYVQADERPGRVVCRTRSVDAEYLLSQLFGLPTSIPGFDELFGGGGIQFIGGPENEATKRRLGIRGRTVLTTGRYGTGKSLLALQVAVEVARKGGVAWVLTLEQEAEECLYLLNSMQAMPSDKIVKVATDMVAARKYLKRRESDRGVLIFLTTRNDSYSDLLKGLHSDAEDLKAFPLRLIVIDPVNAIRRDIVVSRPDMLNAFESVTETGTNLWLNSEDTSPDGSQHFEQNLADTVIHLSAETESEYGQRYLEVQKSRYQREQPGKHSFRISSGTGIEVFANPSAVSARIRPRAIRVATGSVPFGLDSLDRILGDEAIAAGDVVVLQGPPACFKTLAGIHFLRGSALTELPKKQLSRGPEQQPSLFAFAVGEAEDSLRRLLKKTSDAWAIPNDVRVRQLPDGLVQPGELLRRLEEHLEEVQPPQTVDRVLMAHMRYMEMSCPYVRNDDVFASTLLQLFRRRGVTSAFICGSVSEESPHLQRFLLEAANCVVQFNRVEFQGKAQVVIRILKSRSMGHRRDWFELHGSAERVEVRNTSSLLRVEHNGTGHAAGMRLFLHAESDIQRAYNETVADSVRSVLTRNVILNSQSGPYYSRALLLGDSSVLDELQVLQLDEFQIPRTVTLRADVKLHRFDRESWYPEEWDDLLPGLHQRATSGDSMIAVPFYANVSILAYRQDEVDEADLMSWQRLAVVAEEYNQAHSASSFFDFAKVSGENYNCLFFEILLSLAGLPEFSGCGFDDWLSRPEAVEATTLFHRLCRRSHAGNSGQRLEAEAPMKVNPDARVWRHWFTTLMEMLSGMPQNERAKVRIATLPNRVTIAGEWYLAVPAHSAAPDVALAFIRTLTSREAELERLRRGVGLPTRNSFYNRYEVEPASGSHSTPFDTPLSPFIAIDIAVLGDLVRSAFRRSSFACYTEFSGILSAHLERILDLEAFRDADAKQMLRSLKDRIQFLRTRDACLGCRKDNPALAPAIVQNPVNEPNSRRRHVEAI